MNESKILRWAMLGVLGASLSLPTLAAGEAQTAAGAQQFLAEMARQLQTSVRFVDSAGRANYVTGKYTGQVKTIKGGAFGKPKESIAALPEEAIVTSVSDVRATELESIDVEGRQNACATRITTVTSPPYDVTKSYSDDDSRAFSFTLTYTDQQWTYEPLTKFMSPAQVIDWGNALIVRRPDAVTVVVKGQSFARIELTYGAGSLDLADRIEYAMKFLKMSCADDLSAAL